jgi:hypothetical protein
MRNWSGAGDVTVAQHYRGPSLDLAVRRTNPGDRVSEQYAYQEADAHDSQTWPRECATRKSQLGVTPTPDPTLKRRHIGRVIRAAWSE